MVDLTSLDSLLGVLFDGNVPAFAITPPSDEMARFDAIQGEMERLEIDGSAFPFPPVPRLGWAGVFAVMRVLLRQIRSRAPASNSAPPPPDLTPMGDGSFGRDFGRGALHVMAQQQAGSSSSAATADAPMQTAVLTAAAAVDSEGRLPPDQRVIGLAVNAANVTAAGVDGSVLQPLRALGASMDGLPQALHQLDVSGGAMHNTMASSHMLSVSTALTSVSTVFTRSAARALRDHMARDGPAHCVPEKRKTDTQTVIRYLIRGRPLDVTLQLLYGAGGDLLSGIALSSSLSEWESSLVVLDHLSFAVSLFYQPSGGEVHNFFSRAREVAKRLCNEESMPAHFVAAYITDRARTLQNDFQDFYRGSRLVRPRYDSSWFTGPEAQSVLARVQGDVLRDLQQRVQQSAPSIALAPPQLPPAPVAGHLPPPFVPGAPFPPHVPPWAYSPGWQPHPLQQYQPPPPGPAPVPNPKRAAQRSRRKAAAAAARAAAPLPAVQAAAPAPVAPPVVAPVAPPAGPVAPRPVPAINVAGVIDGVPHTGPATPLEMRTFTAAHPGTRGIGLCFDFWRRGMCHRGDQCRFQHV